MKNICCICGKEIPSNEVFEKIVLPTGKEICKCYPCYDSIRAADAHAFVFTEVAMMISSYIEDGEISQELGENMLTYMIQGEADEIISGFFSKKDAISLVNSIIAECKDIFNADNNEEMLFVLDDLQEDLDERLDCLDDNYTLRVPLKNEIIDREGWEKELKDKKTDKEEAYAYTYWYHLLKDLPDLKNDNINKNIFDEDEDY